MLVSQVNIVCGKNGVMDNFMQRLDAEIEKRGLTRRQLAVRGGFDPSVLSNYSNGTKNPSVEVCKKIAKVLDLPHETLMEWAGLLEIKKGESAAIRELRNVVSDDVTDDEAYVLIDIARAFKARRRTVTSRGGGSSSS